MEIEIYDGIFPVIMVARAAPRSYPFVQAVLKVDMEAGRFIIELVRFWRDGEEEKLKEVMSELLLVFFDLYGHHKFYYEIDGHMFRAAKGLLNKTGITLIPLGDQECSNG
jgi:hypothetical protein